MRNRCKTGYLCAFVLLIVGLPACVDSNGAPLSEARALQENQSEKIICSVVQAGTIRDLPVKYFETYHLNNINNALEKYPQFRELVGVEHASNCEDARKIMPYWDDFFDPSSTNTPPSTGMRTPKIHNGIDVTIPDIPGTVDLEIYDPASNDIGHCTGIIITRKAILTAAHCVDWAMTTNTGLLAIRAAKVNSNGNFGSPFWSTNILTNVVYHPSYAGIYNTGNDIAILHRNTNIQGLSDEDFTSIYVGSLDSISGFPFYGSGLEDKYDVYGTLRVGFAYNMHHRGQYSFRHDVGTYRPCRGDSGGPAFLSGLGGGGNYDHPAKVLGLASGTRYGGVCTEDGGEVRWVRVGPKLDWVESELDVTCVLYTDTHMGNQYQYKKCASTILSGCNSSKNTRMHWITIMLLLAWLCHRRLKMRALNASN